MVRAHYRPPPFQIRVSPLTKCQGAFSIGGWRQYWRQRKSKLTLFVPSKSRESGTFRGSGGVGFVLAVVGRRIFVSRFAFGCLLIVGLLSWLLWLPTISPIPGREFRKFTASFQMMLVSPRPEKILMRKTVSGE